MKPWIEMDECWLEEVLEALPRPWPDGAGMLWLRYATSHAACGERYWTPSWASEQEPAARKGVAPGRRMLAAVAGWGEKKARLVLEGGAWRSPRTDRGGRT